MDTIFMSADLPTSGAMRSQVETSRFEKIRRTFNEFDGTNHKVLEEFYSPKILFIDPIHEVEGLAELKRYYAGMYKNVREIRFTFQDFAGDGHQTFATWVMTLSVNGLNGGKSFDVSGSSHFKFSNEGLVEYHRDYFDAGAMVYERLPALGTLIRGVKKFLKS